VELVLVPAAMALVIGIILGVHIGRRGQ